MHRVWSSCRLVLTGGVIVAALACGSLTTSSSTSLAPCSGAVTIDVTFDQNAVPSFSWSPVCGVSRVTVLTPDSTASDSTTVWDITAPALTPFAPGLHYGETPPGTSVWTSAQPLATGAAYRVVLTSLVDGDIGNTADTSFTVPAPSN